MNMEEQFAEELAGKPRMQLLDDGKLFWEVQLPTIDPIKHYRYVIVRVAERGSWQQYKEMVAFYPKEMIVEAMKKERTMDPMTANFMSLIFDIPKTEMRCYKQKFWLQEH